MNYNYYMDPNHQSFQPVGINPTATYTNGIPDSYHNPSPPYSTYDQNLDQFQPLDAYNHFDTNATVLPLTPQSSHQPSIGSISVHGASEVTEFATTEQRQGSNSDDEDMTPAQQRRKAQNRAAQRAFRERKERKVKELEAEVAALKNQTSAVVSENESLKASLQQVETENKVLKATSSSSHTPSAVEHTGPLHYTPVDQNNFYSNVLQPHNNKELSHRIVKDVDGGSLLAAAATWDFIMEHKLVKAGMVNIQMVSDLIKPHAKCDGMGPVFAESTIVEAIKQSVGHGDDDTL